jgi:hypothetical protein
MKRTNQFHSGWMRHFGIKVREFFLISFAGTWSESKVCAAKTIDEITDDFQVCFEV